MKLVDHALSVLQKTLRDLALDAKSDDGESGVPPSVFHVRQWAPSQDARRDHGTPIARWVVSAKEIRSVPPDYKPPEPTTTGMYYESGRASFSISDDPPVLRIRWQLGPRHGHGVDIPLQDGRIVGPPRAVSVA